MKTITLLFVAFFAGCVFSQAPTIAGDTMLCPNTSGTASVTSAQIYDSYAWYWKYWFTSDPFTAIPGADGPSFTYDWDTFDQAQLKVVVTLSGETYESNIIQIDSYAWVGLAVGYQDSANISQDPETGNVLLCQGTGFTLEVYMPYTQVQWYRNGVAIQGETAMQLQVTQEGSYHVVAAPGFCPNSSDSTAGLPIVVEINSNCGLGTGTHQNTPVAVYPNPANTQLIIATEKPVDQISIYDLTGQSVYSDAPQRTTVDVSKLASGIYILNVVSGGKTQRTRFIKQ